MATQRWQPCCYCKVVIPGMRASAEALAAHNECFDEAVDRRLGWPDRRVDVYAAVAERVAAELAGAGRAPAGDR